MVQRGVQFLYFKGFFVGLTKAIFTTASNTSYVSSNFPTNILQAALSHGLPLQRSGMEKTVIANCKATQRSCLPPCLLTCSKST